MDNEKTHVDMTNAIVTVNDQYSFLQRMLNAPNWVLGISCMVIIGFAIGLKNVQKDPSVDAFVPQDHPAAINRDMAKEIFGLEDPIVIGLVSNDGRSVLTTERLSVLRQLDKSIRMVEGVKKNDVISLANQNAISGNNGDLQVEPIIKKGVIDESTVSLAKQRLLSMPMLNGLLISGDQSMLTVIVPVDDPNQAFATVEYIKQLTEQIAGEVFTVQVAGVAAMNARLSHMVNTDTRIFVPLAIVTVLIILIIANRRPRAIIGPLAVIIGSAAIAIGMMGWLNSSYYLITTALPVVIMAIAVADCLHITTYYLKSRSMQPELTAKQAVTIAFSKAWVPISLTSITTVAAFIGLSFGAAMRPISEFGYYAAVGVTAAWVLSLSLLPAILILTDLKPKSSNQNNNQSNHIEPFVIKVTQFALTHSVLCLVATSLLFVALVYYAAQAQFDYERQRYFASDDPVRIADDDINSRLGGINFLDVVVSSEQAGGLMLPEALMSIQSLREQMTQLEHVEKVSGIDEYIALMHRALVGTNDVTLPERRKAPAQYMFLYEASAPPEDFKQEIDFNHQKALIRAQLGTDRYSLTQPTIKALESILEQWRSQTGLTANISGRVAVNDGWMTQLANNHFRGLGLAIILVFITCILVFKSLRYAVLAMVPVMIGIVSVYATMGLLRIDIAPATSMTAAIATGLGIDFGIHLISYIKNNISKYQTIEDTFKANYSIVVRACFYSAVGLGVALAVICISSAPPLRWFGLLVSIGAFGSLIGALFIIPAIWSIYNLFNQRKKTHGYV